MKSSHKAAAHMQNAGRSTVAAKGSNNYNNEMNSGEVGAAGGDNGASTLRELRKKHGSSSDRK